MVVALAASVAIQVALFGAVAVWRFQSRSARRRQLEEFERATAEARRLAQDALIVEASMTELAELVVEQSLLEMGMEWTVEAS